MIKTFKPNEKEYEALKAVANMLTLLCTNGYKFDVEDTYFDFGQNWMWTTIIAKKDNDDSYQVLSPREHELITENICLTRIEQALNEIINESNGYEYIAKFN